MGSSVLTSTRAIQELYLQICQTKTPKTTAKSPLSRPSFEAQALVVMAYPVPLVTEVTISPSTENRRTHLDNVSESHSYRRSAHRAQFTSLTPSIPGTVAMVLLTTRCQVDHETPTNSRPRVQAVISQKLRTLKGNDMRQNTRWPCEHDIDDVTRTRRPMLTDYRLFLVQRSQIKSAVPAIVWLAVRRLVDLTKTCPKLLVPHDTLSSTLQNTDDEPRATLCSLDDTCQVTKPTSPVQVLITLKVSSFICARRPSTVCLDAILSISHRSSFQTIKYECVDIDDITNKCQTSQKKKKS